MPKALITGCSGQDGSYLTAFLLAKGYEVHGLKRRASSFNTDRLDHIYQDFHEAHTGFSLHYADLTDGSSLATLLYDIRPDEFITPARRATSESASRFRNSPRMWSQPEPFGCLRPCAAQA